MARPKTKDNTPISLRMDSKVVNELREYCAKHGTSQSFVMEAALERYFDDQEEKERLIKEIVGQQKANQ